MLAFERMFGPRYSVREKYFYFLLRELCHTRAPEGGWLIFHDSPSGNLENSFKHFGLSPRICHSAREKLAKDGLIEYRHAHGPKGHRIGMQYRILDAKVDADPKAVHAAIIGNRDQEVVHKPAGSQGVQGFSDPIAS